MRAIDADTCRMRPVTDADGTRVGELIAACFAEYEGCLFEPREFPELAAIATAFETVGGQLWVAEASGRIVGSLGVRPGPGDAVEIMKVYVAAEWRGSGLADRLLARAFAFAREHGADQLELWSDTRFERAHAFYTRRGFARTGEERFLADVSDSWEWRFVHPLAPARC